MTRIERVTSPLPRECSTTEPHGHRHGPGRPSRGAQAGVDDSLRPQPSGLRAFDPSLERETGIEPASLAWKAKVLPLNYSRRQKSARSVATGANSWIGRNELLDHFGGGGWIRTSVGVSQQIYSLPPLATRAPLHAEPAMLAHFQPVAHQSTQPAVARKWLPCAMKARSKSCAGWRVRHTGARGAEPAASSKKA